MARGLTEPLNPLVAVYLEDAAHALGHRESYRPAHAKGERQPTQAARLVDLWRHERPLNRRLIPMPPATRFAVQGYLAEREVLLGDALLLLSLPALHMPRRRRMAARMAHPTPRPFGPRA